MEPISPEKQHPSKPRQVEIAVKLIYISIALTFLYSILIAIINWQDSPPVYPDPFTFICDSVFLLFAIFIANKIAAGRNWARIWLLISFILGLFQVGPRILYANGFSLYKLALVFFIALDFAILILLYQAPSSAWFKSRKVRAVTESDLKDNRLATERSHPTPESTASGYSFPDEALSIPVPKIVTIAGAVGAGIGLMNAVFWVLIMPPQSQFEREGIYLMILFGFALGAACGAFLGFSFLNSARKNPKRDPIRWAIFGGILGGLISFICGLFGTAFALQGG